MKALATGCGLLAALAVPALASAEITVPDGFTVMVAHDGVGSGARHMVVRDTGDLFIARRSGELVALRDSDGDGVFDQEARRDLPIESAVTLHDGFLYFSDETSVSRLALDDGLMPAGEPETMVKGFPPTGHFAKPLAFDGDGGMYVVSGVPSNACQEEMRSRGSPGQDPCPELRDYGGVWRFSADTPGQSQADGSRYITGLRHAVDIAWSPLADRLAVAQHGRDQLNTLWPDHYDAEANAELPAEEFHLVSEGDDLGWPFTYWNGLISARIIAPEYGGDGQEQAESGRYKAPDYAFPGHWAPMDILFYGGDALPARYRQGAFVSFHGSWNRAPLPQEGYRVQFLPMASNGQPDGPAEDFATGFPGVETVRRPSDARYRPMGLAEGPDGSLYIADSVRGRIWRVTYTGE